MRTMSRGIKAKNIYVKVFLRLINYDGRPSFKDAHGFLSGTSKCVVGECDLC